MRGKIIDEESFTNDLSHAMQFTRTCATAHGNFDFAMRIVTAFTSQGNERLCVTLSNDIV